jgi:hypothetical protein
MEALGFFETSVDLQKLRGRGEGGIDWIGLTVETDKWWARGKEPPGSIKCGEFLD